MFLMSYVPQFGKARVWENWAMPVQLSIYAVLFLVGMACFFWTNVRSQLPLVSGNGG